MESTMPRNFAPLITIVLIAALAGCASSRSGGKGPVRKAVELPVAATEKGLDTSYSAIEKKIRLPGGNKSPMRDRELPLYYEGGSNINSLQRD